MTRPPDAIAGWWAAARSVPARLFYLLLPFLVIGSAAWWFCQMPMYSAHTWPSDWEPARERWEVEWITKPSSSPLMATGLETIMRSPGASDCYYYDDMESGRRLYRVDLHTGEFLERSPWLSRLTAFRQVEGQIIALSGGHPWGPRRLFELHPESLDIVRIRDLSQLPALRPEGENEIEPFVWHELPDRSIAAIVYQPTDEHPYGDQSRWMHIDPEGHRIAESPLPSRAGEWQVWPAVDPEIFLRLGSGDGAVPDLLIDIATGKPVALPESANLPPVAVPFTQAGERPLPFDWNRLPNLGQFAYDIHLFPTWRQPSIFGFGERRPSDGTQELIDKALDKRLQIWRRRYGEDAVTENAHRAIQIHELRLVDARQSPTRVVTLSPEVVASLGLTPRTMFPDAAPPEPPGPFGTLDHMTEPTYQPPLATVAGLPDGRYLLSQLILDPPAHLVTPGARIWRAGVLDAQATQIDWLGWIEVPATLQLQETYNGPSFAPLVYKGEWLLAQKGLPNMPTIEGDFAEIPAAWTTLPIPDAVGPLPEGWPGE